MRTDITDATYSLHIVLKHRSLVYPKMSGDVPFVGHILQTGIKRQHTAKCHVLQCLPCRSILIVLAALVMAADVRILSDAIIATAVKTLNEGLSDYIWVDKPTRVVPVLVMESLAGTLQGAEKS